MERALGGLQDPGVELANNKKPWGTYYAGDLRCLFKSAKPEQRAPHRRVLCTFSVRRLEISGSEVHAR